MTDIIITRRRQRIELLTMLACFAIAFGLNVYAIIAYDGKWSELFWSLGFVVVTAAALYAVWTILRLVFFGTRKLMKK